MVKDWFHGSKRRLEKLVDLGASVEAEEEDSEAEEFASSVDILGEFEIF